LNKEFVLVLLFVFTRQYGIIFAILLLHLA